MSAMAGSAANRRDATGKAWSFGSQIGSFECIRDEDGRPILENRAPAIVKQGVPMNLRRCPYDDERQGRMMNVSALAQITTHIDDTLADITAFHTAVASVPVSWERFAMALYDQLAQCALSILRAGSEDARLSAALSVGYKVSAGYLVPIRELLQLSIQGKAPAASVENLNLHVRSHKSLVGAREVCAAPLTMVDKVSAVFLSGLAEVGSSASAERVIAARGLTQQLMVGLLWQHYDRAVERKLFCDDLPAEALQGQTQHVRRELESRRAALADSALEGAAHMPSIFDSSQLARLKAALEPRDADSQRKWRDSRLALITFIEERQGAIVLLDDTIAPLIALRFAEYLQAYVAFVSVFDEIELELRERLGFPNVAPIQRDLSLFPSPRALPWLEMIAGHRLREVEGDSRWVLRSLKRTYSLPI